ncbi:MAG: HD domain-containing protein [Pelomonas sp.]|nr:HD domain-containing protein [Roseateles sp.]
MGPESLAPGSEDPDNPDNPVNRHFLDHVVKSCEAQQICASEDIYAGNGIKLLSKGAAIDGQMHERLLQHKLVKPLESSIETVDQGVGGLLARTAGTVMAKQPMVAELAQLPQEEAPGLYFSGLDLSAQTRTMLMLYADIGPGKLEHAVGVALVCLGLARRLLPRDETAHHALVLAGLLHDVGELYIDPALLVPGARLPTEAWRHVASHPIIGLRVLANLRGAGRRVADAVLLHHERLDGFGYPRGTGGAGFSLDGQITATAEWLIGFLGSGGAPLARARVAAKLLPGEFGAPMQQVLRLAAQDGGAAALDWHQSVEKTLPELERTVRSFDNFDAHRAEIEQALAKASAPMRRLGALALERLQRLQAAFASSGLNGSGSPRETLAGLTGHADAEVQQEVVALTREFSWRLRELERESLLRASLLGGTELAQMAGLMNYLRTPAEAVATLGPL